MTAANAIANPATVLTSNQNNCINVGGVSQCAVLLVMLNPNSAANITTANVNLRRLEAHVKTATTGRTGRNWMTRNDIAFAFSGLFTENATISAEIETTRKR